MKSINIGNNIAELRKEKEITQEELAGYLGVSKPAVSKWESGQSYPDITLLPILASYFNVTVDRLLGYKPQMSAEDIKDLYIRFSKSFAEEPFEKVYLEWKKYIKKYFSCWKLLFAMGCLIVNHASLIIELEKVKKIYREAIEIFERIEKEGEDPSLAKQSLHMKAVCYIAMNEPKKAIELLKDMIELPMSSEVLLAKAYQMESNSDKAKALLQRYIYENIVGIIGACPDLMMLLADNPIKMEQWSEKFLKTADVFNMNEIHPSLYLSIYLTLAQVFIMKKNKEKTIENLEKYVKIIYSKDFFPLKLKGNEFFDSLDDFLNSLYIGTSTPRNDEVIKKSIVDAVKKNPAFKEIEDDSRYKILIKKLEKLI